jgi:hypothetical protein
MGVSARLRGRDHGDDDDDDDDNNDPGIPHGAGNTGRQGEAEGARPS